MSGRRGSTEKRSAFARPSLSWCEYLVASYRERGTLYSDFTLARMQNEIRQRISWKLGVSEPSPSPPTSAPNVRPDPYPEDDGSEAEFTLAEVGKAIGVSGDRARQIEAGALHKFRKNLIAALRRPGQSEADFIQEFLNV